MKIVVVICANVEDIVKRSMSGLFGSELERFDAREACVARLSEIGIEAISCWKEQFSDLTEREKRAVPRVVTELINAGAEGRLLCYKADYDVSECWYTISIEWDIETEDVARKAKEHCVAKREGLIALREAAKSFEDSYEKFVEAISDCYQNPDIPTDDYILPEYPFVKSFDELEIQGWISTLVKNVSDNVW